MKSKKIFGVPVALAAVIAAIVVAGCGSAAQVASHNISTEADNFQIARNISFYNGITGQNILVIKGLCSIGSGTDSTNPPSRGGDLTVTCETKPGKFIKDFLGLSDNVTYVSQQVVGASVSDTHYEVIWRPSTLIPNINIDTSASSSESGAVTAPK
jgi:hypothetical protein